MALQGGMREVTQYAAPPHRMQLAQPCNALHLRIERNHADAVEHMRQRMPGCASRLCPPTW